MALGSCNSETPQHHAGIIINQMGLLIPAVLGQAKDLSEEYLYEVKKETFGLDAICLWIPPFSYYLLHVPVRTIPNALLGGNSIIGSPPDGE